MNLKMATLLIALLVVVAAVENSNVNPVAAARPGVPLVSRMSSDICCYSYACNKAKTCSIKGLLIDSCKNGFRVSGV